MDYSTLAKFDKQKMHEIYDRWPEIARNSYESENDIIHFDNISHIVFAGMGGSGAIGDIFYSILSKTKIHVSVVKGYLLPSTVDSETLVVPTSISGNTLEILTILESAKKTNAKIIAFSSGGKMMDYCNQNKIEHRKIPMFHSPRSSFTSFLYSMLEVLQPVLPIQKNDVIESIQKMEETRKIISSQNMNEMNTSINIAKWIKSIPLIYYPLGLRAAAIRFKNSLQENAKIHAMAEDVIEACHNGVVSWEKKSVVNPILIEGADDHSKTKERWNILKKFFEINSIDFKEVRSVEGTVLSKLINLIYLLDYASIYLAVLSGIDPSPVKSIDYIKGKL